MSEEQRLGRYIIEDQLGEGSFAWVYKGYDEELDRHVALKVLKPVWMSDMNAVTRFKQEARTMAKLIHPNIAVIYEVGEEDGQVFLAQFLVNGDTLSKKLEDEGPMSWSEMIDMVRPVASALDYAHEHDMIHRDIKPANILVDDKGKAFLGDFGLVRAAEGSASISASTGGMVGTPAYMAPEQWEGKEVSPATDVYALSCVVVEMLTGKMLFDGATPATVMKQHLMEGPRFPAQWPEGVPERIVDVLKKGLAEESAERISSAGALVAELEKAEEADTAVFSLPWLVDANGKRHKLKPGSTTLGRGKNSDIHVDTAMISRQHATIDFDGQQVTVYDEGSANGTFVNGERIGDEGHILDMGDTLMVGDTSFVLGSGDAEVELPAAAAGAAAVGATAATMMGGAELEEMVKSVKAEAATDPAPAPPAEPTLEAVAEDSTERETMVAATAPAEATPEPVAAAAPEKEGGGKGMMIVGAVVVLLIIAGAIGFFMFSGGGGGAGEQAASSGDSQSSSAAVAVDADEDPTVTSTSTPANTPKPDPTDTPEPKPTDTPEPAEAEPEEEVAPDLDEIISQADELMNKGEFEDAIPLLNQAIDIDPENAGFYNMRGVSHYGLENYDEAIADFDQSLTIDPGDDTIYNFRGVAYLDNDDFEDALENFEQAIAINSADGDYHFNRAVTLDILGDDFEEALAGYTAAIARYDAAGIDAEYQPYAEAAARIAELEGELGVVAEADTQPTDTPEPAAAEPTDTPAPVPTEIVANISGHIAIPLLAGSEPRVYVVDTNGSQVNVLNSARQPAHTLDGGKLVVNGDGGSQLLLRTASANGGGAQEIGDPTLNAHSFPTWSPDGTSVAYLDRFGTTDYHMFTRKTTNNSGTGDELFAQGNGAIFHSNPMYPKWSGQGLVFRGCSTWTGQGGNCGTWLLPGQQGSVSQITTDANHIPTDASNDTVVFSWNQGGNWDVYAANISSGAVTRLTNDPAQDGLGTISPDGNTVAFLSNRGGGLAVWYVSIDGGEATKMFDIESGWGALRGDGWSEETLSWGK